METILTHLPHNYGNARLRGLELWESLSLEGPQRWPALYLGLITQSGMLRIDLTEPASIALYGQNMLESVLTCPHKFLHGPGLMKNSELDFLDSSHLRFCPWSFP